MAKDQDQGGSNATSLQVGVLAGIGPAGGCIISRNIHDSDFDYGFRWRDASSEMLAAIRADPERHHERHVVYRLTEPKTFFRGGASVRYAIAVEWLDQASDSHMQAWRDQGHQERHGIQRMDCPATRSGAHDPEVKLGDGVVSFVCANCRREFDY